VILFSTVTKGKSLLDVDLVIADTAEYLAAEDMSGLAMKYLELNASAKQSNVAYAKDRVFNSDSTKSLQKQFVRPAFPYQVEKVRVQMSQYTRALSHHGQ
jgi:hypothetical protein